MTSLDHQVLGPAFAQTPYDHPFRVELRAWLAEHPVDPEPLDQDARFRHRRDWHRTMAGNGWVGLHWPVEHGGRGVDPLTQFMYYEEVALAATPEPVNTPGLILLGPTLMAHGSAELKARFLPGILSGDEMWCQGFSEPDSGSDLASLRTRAELVGDEWIVNGQKIWTTFAQYADYCFVLCRTEAGSERHRGLTLLICPVDQDGVTVRPIRQISGDNEFSEVFLDDARVPKDWVVGEVGQGWSAAMTLFQFERGDQGYTDHARMLVHLLDCEDALRVAEADGTLTVDRAADARRVQRDLWVRIQELRHLNYRGAVLAKAGQELGAVGSMTNLVWGELEKDLGSAFADASGARSLVLGRHDTHARLASRAASIYSGTSEIQRNIIAERLLGLPK
ncbi:acyl-CoA dehydrogenase family protein [Nocardioides sp.]|uniref:acyl-CoA dehydrogenase family protein n=1 Tax=Nocardioides sp. TaxID=35761 RepID=UPI0031FE8ED8|nr:acyl-CoA dehydrogenase [Nocardioides sp.]